MKIEFNDRTQKAPDEMNFDEFVSWAAGYILFGIGSGQNLRDLLTMVVDLCCRNKVFGGHRSHNEM